MCMSCGHTPIYKNIAYVLYVPNWWHRFFLMALELRCLLKYPTSSHAHVEEISEQQRQMDEERYEEKLMMRSQSEVKVWCVWTLGIPKSNGNTHHSPLTLPQDYYWIFIHIYSMSEAPAMLNDGKPWDCCYVFPFPPTNYSIFSGKPNWEHAAAVFCWLVELSIGRCLEDRPASSSRTRRKTTKMTKLEFNERANDDGMASFIHINILILKLYHH